MMFHSVPFLVLLAGAVSAWWLLAEHRVARLSVLLGASVLFYSAWNPAPLLVFAALAAVNFIAGHALARLEGPRARRLVMVAAVTVHLGTLVSFKYLSLFASTLGSLASALGLTWAPPVPTLVLPIGLSFVVFQAISFVVDTWRGQTRGARPLLHHLVYLTFFPQVVAGPILRAHELLDPLEAPPPRVTPEEEAAAIFRIAQGIAKKLLVADLLAMALVDPVFTNPTGYSAAECALAAVAYTFQIYFDFSGYSDIAIGAGALFGFKFPENFARPYHATNLYDFWNRWHLTLSTWLRDYLYRPLGGNQGTRWQTLRNTMVVMSLGGLWHGADWRFLVWGGLHGLLLVAWRVWWWQVGKPRRGEAGALRRAGGWLVTFTAVVFARIFFRADSMSLALDFFAQLGTATANLARVSTLAWATLGAAVVLYAAPRPGLELTSRLFVRSPVWVRAAALVALGLLAKRLASVEAEPYIYFQY